MPSVKVLFGLGVLAIYLAGCRTPAPPTASPTVGESTPRPEAQQQAVLHAVLEALESGYIFEDALDEDWQAQRLVAERRLAGGVPSQTFQGGVKDLVSLLPQGTAEYLSRQERIEADLAASSVYEGIGAFVSFQAIPRPRLVLLGVMPNSPAQDAGLRPHDAILAIDGVPISSDEGSRAVERIRGEAGTEVILEMASPGETVRQVRVRRAALEVGDTVSSGTLGSGVLYVRAPILPDSSLPDRIIRLLTDPGGDGGPAGLVVDLRTANSGATWPLKETLGLFVEGNFGEFYSRKTSNPFEVDGVDALGSQSIPLVIVIGPHTKGLPEVVADVLQSSGRATLVGLPTAGGVLAFDRLVLQDGSLLVYAASSYRSVDGSVLGRQRVTPDVRVDRDWDQVSPADDPVLDAAIEALHKQGAGG